MTASTERCLPEAELRRAIDSQLTNGALPGELEQFDSELRRAAVDFISATAVRRLQGQPAIGLEPLDPTSREGPMRLVIVNDDMPFLVDSVAALMADRGIGIHRLLHPIMAMQRDGSGTLKQVGAANIAELNRESLIYVEIDWLDPAALPLLTQEIQRVLAAVREAVEAYPLLQEALRSSARTLKDDEAAELLTWFLDSRMTLLAYARIDRAGAVEASLGLNAEAEPWLSAASCRSALEWFEAGHTAPLLLKAERISPVHRRVPFDLIVLPVMQGESISSLSVHAGLWSSDALATRPDKVPLLRQQLRLLADEFGFDPFTHAGKALVHAIRRLPHDLLTGFQSHELRSVALTAMSLVDRPRSKIVLVPETLGRHLFAFVWLNRSDLTTNRRAAIGQLIADEARGTVVTWFVDIGDGDLALVRYIISLAGEGRVPALRGIDDRVQAMLRGWRPAVAAALAEFVSPDRAAGLAREYAEAFPAAFRNRCDARDAARDIMMLSELASDADRAVRLSALETDSAVRLRLQIYCTGELLPLSDVVPVLENFGFIVLEEIPTALAGGKGNIHEFLVETPSMGADGILEGAPIIERAIAAVLTGHAENDAFDNLVVRIGVEPRAVILFRAWFRYLRQTGLPYGLSTCADALANAPVVTKSLIALFDARLDPIHHSEERAERARSKIRAGLTDVQAIDDDRMLRRLWGVIEAILRTNAFRVSGDEALAFKLDSAGVPWLPSPRPWREIWVYSPRVEGVHLRAGPIARGGLRWSDRRDDFRTEILGLLKAQIVKNAVIVPTGAKGGFYPKNLPSPRDRAAWIAEGTESYKVFIRALLSLTDNVIDGAIVHPPSTVRHDQDDPYFVVAADKGTASFSDVANAIAIEQGYWLGDAFASGGSNGYDHKAMGITARGAWVSVQRHFAELGIDVQRDPITVVGCGDMSGDVFGNGMLLSRSIRLVAAFDHRNIFIDPSPDPAMSWEERQRLFSLPSSSWQDYDPTRISAGGGVYDRLQKEIALSAEAGALVGLDAGNHDPATIIRAFLKAPVDLLWFGGIGTYVKSSHETHLNVRDAANDSLRIDADQLRAKVIGEGANLSITQAGRIEFGLVGGRSNADFVDNSAGVDCSDNEVNIKIALNADVASGKMLPEDRNALLAAMTDDVADLVLEDNRMQSLALSIAERGGPTQVVSQIGVVSFLEANHGLNRDAEGLGSDDHFARRARDGKGLTRPELAVIMAHAKLTLQAAIEASPLASDPSLSELVSNSFPPAMRQRHHEAIATHQLRREILATKIANIVVNRLGFVALFELADEEGVSLARVAGAYFACDQIFGLSETFAAIEREQIDEAARIQLLEIMASLCRLQVANILRSAPHSALPHGIAALLAPGIYQLDLSLVEGEQASDEATDLARHITSLGAHASVAQRIAMLQRLSEASRISSIAAIGGGSVLDVEQAYTRLGEVLSLAWATSSASRLNVVDAWERLQVRAIARDCQQLRSDFLLRTQRDGRLIDLEEWFAHHQAALERFRALADRIRAAPTTTAPMLAELVNQARTLLTRRPADGGG